MGALWRAGLDAQHIDEAAARAGAAAAAQLAWLAYVCIGGMECGKSNATPRAAPSDAESAGVCAGRDRRQILDR